MPNNCSYCGKHCYSMTADACENKHKTTKEWKKIREEE